MVFCMSLWQRNLVCRLSKQKILFTSCKIRFSNICKSVDISRLLLYHNGRPPDCSFLHLLFHGLGHSSFGLWLKSFFCENYTKCTQKAPVGFIACGFYFLYDTSKEVRLVGQYIARLMMIGFSARSAYEQEQDDVEILFK